MARTLAAGVAFCALTIAPRAALACGGFFCSTTPVDQAGETIVYGLEDDGTLTMAIQIAYAGNDDDFAWILPVVAPPEIAIGSDALFSELRRVTEPTFVRRDVREGTCRPHPACVSETTCMSVPDYSSSGCGYDPGPSDPWTGGFVDAGAAGAFDAGPRVADAATDGAAPGVTVFSQGPIGPYETVVLGAATAVEVVDWLAEHGYDVPTGSLPLLEPYAAAGQVFVALRLRSNVDTRSIRPIVLRMPTSEACLPIRLTAIATVPTLPVTTLFLGRMPVTPSNFSSVDVDVRTPAYWTGERSWSTELQRLVQSRGGQAFVREYVGPTPAITIAIPDVAGLAGVTDPATYVQALQASGSRGDTILLELLETYLRPPEGYPGRPQDYYNCLAAGRTESCGESASFDPVGLTAQIEAQIVGPRQAAIDLVYRHGTLTRLSTAIRAEDMTVDPVFIEDEGIEPLDNTHEADFVTLCSADYYTESAPTRWRIDGSDFVASSGSRADDHAYCASRGLILASEARDCPEPSSSSRSSGGCLCFVGGTAPMQGGALLAIAILLGVRRRWRR